MSDWDYELQTTALILSGMAFILSVTMMMTFYWSYLKQAKSTQAMTEEINRRMAEQDKLIHETEAIIKEEVVSSISHSGKHKEANRGMAGLDKMVYETEVGSSKGGLWSSIGSSGYKRKESLALPSKDTEVDIYELKQKMTLEVIPYVSLLKFRLKQFGRRLQSLETLMRSDRKSSGVNRPMDFTPDLYELSPPEAESVELENGSPQDIRVYYEILKQTEKAVSYKHILEDQEKKIKYLQNIARVTIEKLQIPEVSSNIDTGILSTVDSDASHTTAPLDTNSKPKTNTKTSSWLNVSKYKRSKT